MRGKKPKSGRGKLLGKVLPGKGMTRDAHADSLTDIMYFFLFLFSVFFLFCEVRLQERDEKERKGR